MIRKYEPKDFQYCINIINKVWSFNGRYSPQGLSDFLKKTYHLTSLSKSNFTIVVEEEGEVHGFLFGKCGKAKTHKNEYSGLRGKFRMITDMFFIKGVSFKKMLHYLWMERVHEKNRQQALPGSENEIILFAVDPIAQGKGLGKRLIGEFIKHCREKNAQSVTVETDQASNYNFYYSLGFKKIGEFYSPSLKEYTGASGISYVFELDLN